MVAAAWLVVRRKTTASARPRPAGRPASSCRRSLHWHHAIARIGAGPATWSAPPRWPGSVLAWALYRDVPAGPPSSCSGGAHRRGAAQRLRRRARLRDRPGGGSCSGWRPPGLFGVPPAPAPLQPRPPGPRGPLLDATIGALVGSALTALLMPGSPSSQLAGARMDHLLACSATRSAGSSSAVPCPGCRRWRSQPSAVQPAGAVLWAQLLFTETLSPLQWAGVAVVLAASCCWPSGGSAPPAGPRAVGLTMAPRSPRHPGPTALAG